MSGYLSIQIRDHIWKTSFDYYDNIINYGYHELSHLAIISEIKKLCIDNNLKALHLKSFVPSDNNIGYREYDWDPKLYPSYDTSLESISNYVTYGEPEMANHLNHEGNKYVAELVIKLIKEYKLI